MEVRTARPGRRQTAVPLVDLPHAEGASRRRPPLGSGFGRISRGIACVFFAIAPDAK
jgi:hypothetical protein